MQHICHEKVCIGWMKAIGWSLWKEFYIMLLGQMDKWACSMTYEALSTMQTDRAVLPYWIPSALLASSPQRQHHELLGETDAAELV
jgi:hypothetical protein